MFVYIKQVELFTFNSQKFHKWVITQAINQDLTASQLYALYEQMMLGELSSALQVRLKWGIWLDYSSNSS